VPIPTDAAEYRLQLYVSGSGPRSARAIVNVRELCERHLAGRYDLQVIDISVDRARARAAQLAAAPTLIKHWPLPAARFVGDMSRADRILPRLLAGGMPAPG
jgi:circadian clock protein KaiB